MRHTPLTAFVRCGVLFFLASCGSTTETPQDSSREVSSQENETLVHTTYLVGNRIQNRAQLDQTRFNQFDFLYLMAGPQWEAEDFEALEDQVTTTLVENHSYPTGDSGLALVPELIERAHREEVRVLLSIPGSERFNPVVSQHERRSRFARVMAAFVEKYDYDGIEIDWEHTYEMDQHTALMGDLRQALNALQEKSSAKTRRYYLTTALHSWRKYSKEQAEQLSRSVDWINIMTYDMGGGIWGRVPTHNTPLNTIKQALQDNWSEFSPQKLCIGLANYGFYYQGISPGQKSEVSLKEKGRYFVYTELPALLKEGWKESYDTTAEAPYYFSPDNSEFVTIDSQRSHNRKMEWVFEQRFRGVFWWEFHCDYFPSAADQTYATHPLIDNVSDQFKVLRQNR